MTTPNFAIPELAASQAQKYVTVNEAFRVVDTAINLTVIRADLTTPPGSPSEGDKYIPLATATGTWTGKENDIAVFINAEWIFFTPAEGWRAYNQNTNELLVFNGISWAPLLDGITSEASDGSVGSPSFAFASDPNTGLYKVAADQLGFATGGGQRLLLTNTQSTFSTPDVSLVDANGGGLRMKSVEEELTALSGASVASSVAFPNQSIILGVSLRVTTTITGATSFDCGDGVTVDRFGGALGLAAGFTNQGVIGPAGNYASTTVVLTANGSNFTGGAVRICLNYLETIAPTS